MKNNWKGDFYDEIGFSYVIIIYIYIYILIHIFIKGIYPLIILIIFNKIIRKEDYQLISIYNIGLREIISQC